MSHRAQDFQQRIESLSQRVAALGSLRRLVPLPPPGAILERQWTAVESQLTAAANTLQLRVKRAARDYIPRLDDREAARALNQELGELELAMNRAYTFFDTYVDVLTQRLSPSLGPQLAGCDVLAADALRRQHPALSLVEPPLVYCDRGFGASVLREGVAFPDTVPNPLPLIQIPYSRLQEKYNLTSVLHEAAHEALTRTGLVAALPEAIRATLVHDGADRTVADLYALWASEIGPDFWGFCASGSAQAATIREILALPAAHAFHFSWTDPHPPPYLRALLAFAWCRHLWGVGEWDRWEQEWEALYPLDGMPVGKRKVLSEALRVRPSLTRTLFDARFRALSHRRIADLFDLDQVSPVELDRVVQTARAGHLRLGKRTPCAQLAVFRAVRESGILGERSLDALMDAWLRRLQKDRGRPNPLVIEV